ncbi:MAG: MATE family efflux transporter [Bacteroidia bacterium]
MIGGVLSVVGFNLVDAYFLGQYGEKLPEELRKLPLAAIGFAAPVVLVLNALGMGFGTGAAAVISRAVGEGDREKIKRLTTDSLSLALIFALMFVISGLVSIDPLFRALGAGDAVMPYIKDYMYVWYIGVVFVIVPFVGNAGLRAAGDARTPAIIMMSMVGLNLILDPLLIFGWGPVPSMGMEGAALATVLARALSLVLGLYFLRKRNMLTFSFPAFPTLWLSWKSILHIGLPAAATNLVVPLTTSLIVRITAQFGPAAVAALGVAARIDVLAITVVVALSSILGPFVGQNLGAKRLDRVRKGINLSIRFGLVWGVAMFGLMFLLKDYIAPVFNDDPEVVGALILYLSIAPFGYAMRSVYALGNTLLNVLNRPYHASAITLVMMFCIYLPLAWIGSEKFGLGGVFAAIPIAFTLGGSISYWILMKELKKEEQKAEAV